MQTANALCLPSSLLCPEKLLAQLHVHESSGLFLDALGPDVPATEEDGGEEREKQRNRRENQQKKEKKGKTSRRRRGTRRRETGNKGEEEGGGEKKKKEEEAKACQHILVLIQNIEQTAAC